MVVIVRHSVGVIIWCRFFNQLTHEIRCRTASHSPWTILGAMTGLSAAYVYDPAAGAAQSPNPFAPFDGLRLAPLRLPSREI